MSHQDKSSSIVVNHQTIRQAVNDLLGPALFAGMRTRAGATWKPRMLAVAALLWACSDRTNLRDRFADARKIVAKVFRWQLAPGHTYQGFMKMLRKWHDELIGSITPHIRRQMCETAAPRWKIAGFVVFAADGSRIELARTKSLEETYSPEEEEEEETANEITRRQTRQER